MFGNKFSSAGMLILGFLILGSVSVILNFKHARVVDSFGDAAKVKAEMSGLNLKIEDIMKEDKPDEEKITKLRAKLEKLQNEELPEQRQHATDAMAALPNGAVIWSFLSQVGAGIFGLGLLSVFMREDEHPTVRSTSLIVVGGLVFALLIARTAYLMTGGFSGAGSAF